MKKYRSLFAFLTLLLACSDFCGANTPGLSIAYAPDVIGVDRIFMVAVKSEPAMGEVQAVLPDGVSLLNRMTIPDSNGIYRFYFRALKPAEKAMIKFLCSNQEVISTVTIWSFDDLRAFRMLKGVQLPRRWPLGKNLPELKQTQTITTAAQIAAAKGDPGGAAAWLNLSDDDIWAMRPDSTIPRWHWVNPSEGCPVHGTEIYSVKAYYPWDTDVSIVSMPWKWKIKCPIGGEIYPSNDFAHSDMTSGSFPDDGIGGGCLYEGIKYGFIAQIAQAYCHQMLVVAPSCAQGYLATGDIRYVHKALVALSRLAVEYAYLATMTQHRHRNSVKQVERFGPASFSEGPCLTTSGMTVYGIDQPRYQWLHAEAYDKIFPAIGQDEDIIPFLQGKGFAVTTHEDVRRFIEENLFAVWMQCTMDGAFQSNEPYDQQGFSRMAEVLNYQSGTDFMDWLYEREGRMRVSLTNIYFRDGSPYEATGGYNGMHVSALGPVIDSIEHMRSLRPGLYPESKYPVLGTSSKYHQVFDFDMDTVTMDRAYPSIGDDGDTTVFPAYKKLPLKSWQSGGSAAYENAYRHFLDPKFAWTLVHDANWKPSSDFPFTRQQLEQVAQQWPYDWNDRSSLRDGYGIAILRGGSGDQKRSLWIRYGQARQHTHDDIMDIGLQGYQGVFLSHLGYPRNWGDWEPNWITHRTARQIPFQSMTGQAMLFADSGPVHIAEVKAQAYIDGVDSGTGYTLPPDNWQRRLIALVDVDSEHFYGIDWYRIAGGSEHWWSFSAQEGEVATSNLHLTSQGGGTLAGLDVPYGDPTWLKEHGCNSNNYGWYGPMFGFAHLYNVQYTKPVGPWSADWALKGGDGAHLRLNVASADGMNLNVCDGKPPAGGTPPYEMKWFLLNKKGTTPQKSQILSILEPYIKTSMIQKVEPIVLSGSDEAGFPAAGCKVNLGARTDTILLSADPAVIRSADGGMRFAGRFGLCSEVEGRPVNMTLVGGTLLSKDGFEIRLDSPEYRGRILRMDRAANKITVSPAPSNSKAMEGTILFITSTNRRTAYKVLAATLVSDGVELKLDLDSKIGIGCVSGAKDFQVLTSTPFPLHRFRYYHGARLVNAAHSSEYPLLDVRDKMAAILDPQFCPGANAAKLASQFPVGTWFDVYDYGTGDEVVWPYVSSLSEVSPHVYNISAPVPVQVFLPAGNNLKVFAPVSLKVKLSNN